MVFVFGSNEGGFHGAGAARVAYLKHGAQMGVGYGITGNSFAIPTKDRRIIRSLSPTEIGIYVNGFMQFANNRSDMQFQVTRIGCGLAGQQDKDIAPLFYLAPSNCLFDTKWQEHLPHNFNYWGTF